MSTHDAEHPLPMEERLAFKGEGMDTRTLPTQVTMKRAVTLLELLKADRMALFTDPDGVTERQLMTTSEYMDANELLIWSSVW